MRRFPLLLLLLPALAAADDDDTTHITVVTEVTATSTLKGKGAKTYAPSRVLDMGDIEHGMPPAGGWCEGKPDEGIGEALTIQFAAPTRVSRIVLRAGFWKTEKLFRANNIVTAVDVTTDAGKKTVAIPAKIEPVEVPMGGAPTSKLTVAIAKVKKGRMNDSCISGVEIHTEPESNIVLGLDPTLAAAIPRIERALASCDAKQLAETVAFPFAWAPLMTEDGDRENQGERRVTYPSAAEMAKACKTEDERLTPRGHVPGVDAEDKKGMTLLADGSCGAECEQWGVMKKGGGWKLVWAGPVWVAPKP